MATLKKHGTELARFEYSGNTLVVMSDGHVLRNGGDGWKLFRRAKPGVTAEELARLRTESFNARRAACPNWDLFVRGLCRAVSLRNRWMLAEAIALMPTDPDGVCSILEDHGVSVDLDDVVRIAGHYCRGIAEKRAWEAKKLAK